MSDLHTILSNIKQSRCSRMLLSLPQNNLHEGSGYIHKSQHEKIQQELADINHTSACLHDYQCLISKLEYEMITSGDIILPPLYMVYYSGYNVFQALREFSDTFGSETLYFTALQSAIQQLILHITRYQKTSSLP